MNFTTQDVVAQVRNLADERGEFVYTDQPAREGLDLDEGCGYAGAWARSTEGEGCIIGQALERLGVSEQGLLFLDGDIASTVVHGLTGEDPHSPLLTWLEDVQGLQDGGMSWSDAVARADSYR